MLDIPTIPYTEPPEVPTEDRALLDAYSRAVIDVVDRVGPAVVRLDVKTKDGRTGGGTGSGVIVAPDGLVLTNSHVVNGAAQVTMRPTSITSNGGATTLPPSDSAFFAKSSAESTAKCAAQRGGTPALFW